MQGEHLDMNAHAVDIGTHVHKNVALRQLRAMLFLKGTA